MYRQNNQDKITPGDPPPPPPPHPDKKTDKKSPRQKIQRQKNLRQMKVCVPYE